MMGKQSGQIQMVILDIKELFLEALGILMENRETVIGDCRAVMEALADCSAIDAELEAEKNVY